MGISKNPLFKFIGASAGLHLMIGGLIIFFPLKTVRTTPSVSVIQVVLVGQVKSVPTAAKAVRPIRTLTIVASPARVQARASKPVEPETPDLFLSKPIGLAPVDGENHAALGEPSTLDGSGKGDEETPGQGSRSEELAVFLQDIRGRLEQAKQYPWLARIQGIEGSARVQFMINASGDIHEIRLLESSRSKILDDEAVTTVKRLNRFSHLPVSWNENLKIQVPLVFQLNSP